MSKFWKPMTMLCLLGCLLVLPVVLGCASGAVAPADPVALEESEEEGEK